MLSLADAIIEEDVDQVRVILMQRIEVNQLDEYGYTPLIEAAIADNIEIASLLIQVGANVNLPDRVGGTALHWAVENNNIELCKLLLEHNANPNAYNLAGQPVLVMPILRNQQLLKKLLLQYNADLLFAQDFINTKLLGHLFELVGTADIVDPHNNIVEVDFEGFFLEFSVGLIHESLMQFKNHFAARELRQYIQLMQQIIDVFQRSARLIQLNHYRMDMQKMQFEINGLIQQEPLIIPVGYEGHAITFIKFGPLFIKCDRREDSRLYDNIMFYEIHMMAAFDKNLIKQLIYHPQSSEFINDELPRRLGLQPITELKITAQVSGNCSWANVEACIPALFFLLLSQADASQRNTSYYKSQAMHFFQKWRDWSKDRALHFCLERFHHSDSIRKACNAEILAAILFQCCGIDHPETMKYIDTILPLLADSPYAYVLQNYLKTYGYEDQTEEGKNFIRLLKKYGYLDR